LGARKAPSCTKTTRHIPSVSTCTKHCNPPEQSRVTRASEIPTNLADFTNLIFIQISTGNLHCWGNDEHCTAALGIALSDADNTYHMDPHDRSGPNHQIGEIGARFRHFIGVLSLESGHVCRACRLECSEWHVSCFMPQQAGAIHGRDML
jgi:hypothetical protein